MCCCYGVETCLSVGDPGWGGRPGGGEWCVKHLVWCVDPCGVWRDSGGCGPPLWVCVCTVVPKVSGLSLGFTECIKNLGPNLVCSPGHLLWTKIGGNFCPLGVPKVEKPVFRLLPIWVPFGPLGKLPFLPTAGQVFSPLKAHRLCGLRKIVEVGIVW